MFEDIVRQFTPQYKEKQHYFVTPIESEDPGTIAAVDGGGAILWSNAVRSIGIILSGYIVYDEHHIIVTHKITQKEVLLEGVNLDVHRFQCELFSLAEAATVCDCVLFDGALLDVPGTGFAETLKTMKQENLDALRTSIGQFGLLKPFEVAELPEQLDFFFGKGKYVIIDGQRRYFAIRELLRLPTEQDERRRKESLRTRSGNEHIEKAETQAQKQLESLSIRDFVLIPCLVYPYKTYLQMVRHSTEDSRSSEKSSRIFLEIVEKMRQQGIPDLNPDDLSNLWETRNTIVEEQQAIEETLQEIRTMKKEAIKT